MTKGGDGQLITESNGAFLVKKERGTSSKMERTAHPGSFRKSGKQRSCGIRDFEEDTEDWRWTNRRQICASERRHLENREREVEGDKVRGAKPTQGPAKWESRIHDTRYHRIYNLSSITKVFILSKLRNRSNGRVRERKQRVRVHW